MTGILYPCPECSTLLLFTRENRGGLIAARCGACGVDYAMTPDRVGRIDDIVADEPTDDGRNPRT